MSERACDVFPRKKTSFLTFACLGQELDMGITPLLDLENGSKLILIFNHVSVLAGNWWELDGERTFDERTRERERERERRTILSFFDDWSCFECFDGIHLQSYRNFDVSLASLLIRSELNIVQRSWTAQWSVLVDIVCVRFFFRVGGVVGVGIIWIWVRERERERDGEAQKKIVSMKVSFGLKNKRFGFSWEC